MRAVRELHLNRHETIPISFDHIHQIFDHYKRYWDWCPTVLSVNSTRKSVTFTNEQIAIIGFKLR